MAPGPTFKAEAEGLVPSRSSRAFHRTTRLLHGHGQLGRRGTRATRTSRRGLAARGPIQAPPFQRAIVSSSRADNARPSPLAILLASTIHRTNNLKKEHALPEYTDRLVSWTKTFHFLTDSELMINGRGTYIRSLRAIHGLLHIRMLRSKSRPDITACISAVVAPAVTQPKKSRKPTR